MARQRLIKFGILQQDAYFVRATVMAETRLLKLTFECAW